MASAMICRANGSEFTVRKPWSTSSSAIRRSSSPGAIHGMWTFDGFRSRSNENISVFHETISYVSIPRNQLFWPSLSCAGTRPEANATRRSSWRSSGNETATLSLPRRLPPTAGAATLLSSNFQAGCGYGRFGSRRTIPVLAACVTARAIARRKRCGRRNWPRPEVMPRPEARLSGRTWFGSERRTFSLSGNQSPS
jgi:hypothetical protein